MMNQEENPSLLAVMAHPDDAELLVGGALLHLKRSGWKLGIVTMTTGDCGSATLSKEEISRLRAAEAQAAASYLGAWYGCAGLPDNEVFANATMTIKGRIRVRTLYSRRVLVVHMLMHFSVDP